MQINTRLYNAVIIILIGLFIFLSGRISVQYQLQKNVAPFRIVGEINQKVPVVEIFDIVDAKVIGTVNKPEIRIKSGQRVAIPDASKHFELDIQHLGFVQKKQPKNINEIPHWAKFVASKKGRYFYELDERSAKNLSVKNRIFFATEKEARDAGYIKRNR